MPKNSFLEIIAILGLYICLNYYHYHTSKVLNYFQIIFTFIISFICFGVLCGSVIKW